jgi:hypothetical protein
MVTGGLLMSGIVAYRDGYCRLVGPRETGREQQTEQNQSAHESAGTLTQRHGV